jgi:hypothetical protein
LPGQIRTDLIGAREIFRSFGGVPFSNLRVHFGVGKPSSSRGRREDVKDRIESRQEFKSVHGVPGEELLRIHRRVGIADILEHRGQRFGGVQIVIERLIECFAGCQRRLLQLFIDAR